MKLLISFLTTLITVAALGQDDYKAEIERLRAEKDDQLQSRKTSPLQKKDRKTFHDLPYFEVDEAWKITATFRENATQDIMEIATSAGYSKTFRAYGFFEMDIDGKHFALMAYKREYKEGQSKPEHETLFFPFTDNTTGASTYGGGRYLDLEIPEDGDEVVIDFNLCYSPYCAYGSGFACPIPPASNYIKAEVTAGEMAYDSH